MHTLEPDNLTSYQVYVMLVFSVCCNGIRSWRTCTDFGEIPRRSNDNHGNAESYRENKKTCNGGDNKIRHLRHQLVQNVVKRKNQAS